MVSSENREEMLIDCNAYIGHWPFSQRRNNSCSGVLERMNRFGVSISVVSNLNGVYYKNTQAANEELYAELRSEKHFRDRIIPFAVINPIYSGWRHDVKTCTEEMGMKGIRIYPQYHGYSLTDPACVELVKIARDMRLPVAISFRMVDSRPSSWLDLEIGKEWKLKDVIPILKEVPDAKYMLLNAANSLQLSDEEAGIFKRTDLVVDTSGRAITDLAQLLKQYGKEKFAFGTHAPILDHLTGLLRIESLRPDEADAETKEMLRAGNIKRILGL